MAAVKTMVVVISGGRGAGAHDPHRARTRARDLHHKLTLRQKNQREQGEPEGTRGNKREPEETKESNTINKHNEKQKQKTKTKNTTQTSKKSNKTKAKTSEARRNHREPKGARHEPIEKHIGLMMMFLASEQTNNMFVLAVLQ